jgi:hypothetical protein
VAPTLVALALLLGAANWYVNSAQRAGWAMALTFLAFLVVPLWWVRRHGSSDGSGRQAAKWIESAVGFAAVMLSIPLGGKLALTWGVIDDPGLSNRLTQAVIGAYLVFMGNLMPKMLAPRSNPACDGARAQALQRFSGWTWVMTGLAYAIIWLVLPLDVASPVSMVVVVAGMVAVAAQLFRVWRMSRTRREA